MLSTFGKPVTPCDDCCDGFCTMNCGRPLTDRQEHMRPALLRLTEAEAKAIFDAASTGLIYSFGWTAARKSACRRAMRTIQDTLRFLSG